MILAIGIGILLLLGVAIALLLSLLSKHGHAALPARLDSMEKNADRAERAMREELGRAREEQSRGSKHLREEVQGAFRGFSEDLARLTETNERKLESLRGAVEAKLGQIQEDNARKLEEMRRTVDDQLQGTLEKRLAESFKLVSDRLEQVHKGLGEMQTLASGVDALTRVMTNVKTRGGWGEAQLGSLLADALTRDQYDANVATKPGSNERVEFAIKMPGKDDGNGVCWLPIDAKFPKEDYERLLDAAERADAEGMDSAAKSLETRMKMEARDIFEKYLAPPHTTDFGILFLPSEGLYAEVLRRPGLADYLQKNCRTMVAGPTTLWAILSSLQMGFRTLAIEKRSSDVWKVLGEVKTEFGRFGDALGKVRKKLDEAGSVIDQASTRTREIERKLRGVEELPAIEAQILIGEGEPQEETSS
jgi:DNA recombination protein RmuC